MILEKLNYINFRNLADSSLDFDQGCNLFYGKNGQGKTSLLEAVYFNCTGKSFRTSKASELIKHGKEKCGSFAAYRDRLSSKTLTVKASGGKKEYGFCNNKTTHQEFYGKLSVVSFIPEDIDIITGTPGRRRSFFDEEISQGSTEYYLLVKDYAKLLKIRNQHLKEGTAKGDLFAVYQEQYIDTAAKIIIKRLEYVKQISIILNLNYRKLFDSSKELEVSYVSDLSFQKKESLETLKEKLKKAIEEKFFLEKKYGYSLVGPHRDEFCFLLDGKEAKSFSSQGEKKSIVFSLKLSEVDMIFKEKRENPIFLIDDVTSYFDEKRRDSVLNHLKKKKIQIFISSTELINGFDSFNFYVENGEIICQKFRE